MFITRRRYQGLAAMICMLTLSLVHTGPFAARLDSDRVEMHSIKQTSIKKQLPFSMAKAGLMPEQYPLTNRNGLVTIMSEDFEG
ncbi:hypothetical protein JXO59_13265, partial [candidate division KSB1 bacterium]|nr:hypothetical protein [candidate division KSB1 bacterium]